MSTQNFVRLPKYVKPERYELMLKPNLNDFSFTGEETIFLNLDKPTKELKLHGVEIKIKNNEYLVAGRPVQKSKIKYDPKNETITFIFSKPLPKGAGQLKLRFEGILNDKLRGFYRSKYILNGEEKYLATTQFESTDARRCFPCFDEPSQKAIFDVTLMIQRDMIAVSNTIEEKIVEEHEPGFKLVKFAPSPKMSTYLLAFLIGEFEWVEKKSEDGVVVRVFTTPGKKHQAQFALDFACKALDFYNKYFDIPYPLPVLDMIAVPDFAAGAMENWGAITYRETALLIDKEHSAAANRQRVAIVIAHELAHMWFGDLVTMEWWTHLWLNEGFASYIEYLCVDHLFPDWDMWTQFVYSDMGDALKLDSLETTHPIEVEVHHPNEIGEIFDKVSYSKGASIIRMLANYLGPDTFRDGLRYYLKKHAFSNASTVDLWNAFEKVSNKKVAKIMTNWTSKPGYPLLTAENKNGLIISQSRFFSNASSRHIDKTIWQIPVSIKSEDSSEDKKYLLDKHKNSIPDTINGWYKLNSSESGFYRVKYPSSNLNLLDNAIQNSQLPSIDRLGIIRDLFDLSEAGYISTKEALSFVTSYKSETDFSVWAQITSDISKLDNLLDQEKFYPEFKAFARALYSEIAQKMGWSKRSPDGHTDTLLRSLALYNFGTFGDEGTIQHAKKLFKDSLTSGQKIDSDLRGVVYNLVAENGGEKEYKAFLDLYKKEELQQEKDRLERALSSFKNKILLKKTLEFSLSKDVRLQDSVFIIHSIAANSYGHDLAWEFIQKNWQFFKEKFGGGHFMFTRLIESLQYFKSKEKIREIKTFFKRNPTPEAKRTIAQVLERIESNIDWLKRDKKTIEDFLNSK